MENSDLSTYSWISELRIGHSSNLSHHMSRTEEYKFHVVSLICTTIYYILMFPIIYGNLLVLAAIGMDRRLRRATHVLIASLAISDLIVGVLTVPTFPLVHYMGIGENVAEICMLSYILSHCPTGVSCLTLLVISVERFIAIHHPFKHRRLFTRRLTIGIALFVWFYVCISLPVIMYTNNKWNSSMTECNFGDVASKGYRNILLGHLIGVLFITTVLHSIVGYTAWKSKQRIAKQLHVIRVELKIQRDAKIARMLGMVLGIFYLCWLPYLFTIPLAVTNEDGHDPLWLHIWEQTGGIVILCNSFLNPVVYAWQNKTFRRAFQKILLLKTERIGGRLSFYQGRPSISASHENSLSLDTNFPTVRENNTTTSSI